MVLKGPKCLCSPLRTYVVVVGMLVAASLVTVVQLAVGASSSSSSGLLHANGTFVDFPPGYRYLYPCMHSIRVLFLALNFFCNCRKDIISFFSLLPFRV